MKRFKYQALITVAAPAGGDGEPGLPGPVCRMVVEAHHCETGSGKLFPALVTKEQASPSADSKLLVTLQVAGDDAPEYLAPGQSFGLWREGHAGDGVVTRRLFV